MRHVIYVNLKVPGRDAVFEIVGPFTSLTVAHSYRERLVASASIRGLRIRAEVISLCSTQMSPIGLIEHLEEIVRAA